MSKNKESIDNQKEHISKDYFKKDLEEERILKRWQSKLKRGYLRIITFRMFNDLDKNNNYISLTGNQIRDNINNYTKGQWNPSPGSIYPILAEMESQELIKFIEDDDRRNKKFQITSRGVRIFEKLENNRMIFRPRFPSLDDPESIEKFKLFFKSQHKDMTTEELLNVLKHFTIINSIIEDLIKERSG